MRYARRVGIIIVAVVFSLVGAEIRAAEFPQKPIQVLVGWAAGSQNDSMDRVIAQSLQKILKQPVIIQNVPGAGGSLVLGRVKTEKPDGYTIFQTGTSMYGQTPHIRVVNYDSFKDFAYLAGHARFQHILEDLPSNPWKNYEELIQYAKKNPKKVRYASVGVGTAFHIIMDYLAQRENVQWIQVPYNGVQEQVAALLGGHVDVNTITLGLEIEHIRAGRIRPLLCFNAKRSPVLPDVPTVLEKGYDLALSTYACWSVPINTPKDVQKILEKALLQSFQDPAVIDVIKKWNMAYDPIDGEAVRNIITKDYKVFGDFLSKIGIGIYKK